MIQIKELGPGHIGKWVDYHDGSGKIETGRIKSRNDRVVFVVYAAIASGIDFRNLLQRLRIQSI